MGIEPDMTVLGNKILSICHLCERKNDQKKNSQSHWIGNLLVYKTVTKNKPF
jgi:hypothetical protein